MTTKEIEICGKKVSLGYCYATEIAYKDMSGEDMNDYMTTAVGALQDKKMPDVKKTIYAILSAMMAYYNSIGEETPIKDVDLMNDVTPTELGTAIGTLIAIRVEFYHVPDGEPKEKPAPGGRGRKNA